MGAFPMNTATRSSLHDQMAAVGPVFNCRIFMLETAGKRYSNREYYTHSYHKVNTKAGSNHDEDSGSKKDENTDSTAERDTHFGENLNPTRNNLVNKVDKLEDARFKLDVLPVMGWP